MRYTDMQEKHLHTQNKNKYIFRRNKYLKKKTLLAPLENTLEQVKEAGNEELEVESVGCGHASVQEGDGLIIPVG